MTFIKLSLPTPNCFNSDTKLIELKHSAKIMNPAVKLLFPFMSC